MVTAAVFRRKSPLPCLHVLTATVTQRESFGLTINYYSWKEVSRGDKSRVTCCLELPACLLQRLKVFNSHGSPPQIVIPFLLSNLFYTLRSAFRQCVSVFVCGMIANSC